MVPTRVSHTSTCHTTKHIHHYTYYLRAPSGTESVNTHTYLAGETLSSYIGASSEPSIPRWSLSFFYDQTERENPRQVMWPKPRPLNLLSLGDAVLEHHAVVVPVKSNMVVLVLVKQEVCVSSQKHEAVSRTVTVLLSNQIHSFILIYMMHFFNAN